MAKKNYNKEFLEYITTTNPVKSFRYYLEKAESTDEIKISNLIIKSKILTGIWFDDIIIDKCSFIQTNFQNCNFGDFLIQDCIFNSCQIDETRFDYGYINSSIFDNTNISDCVFNDVSFYTVTIKDIFFTNKNYLRNYILNTKFLSCHFGKFIIESNILSSSFYGAESKKIIEKHEIEYYKSQIVNCNFLHFDLEFSSFKECLLSGTTFVNSNLSSNTLNNLKITQDSCFIDLQTILKSDINEETFKLFGVHGFDPKGYIKELVTEMKFQSVFISYSFQDKEFARALSHILMTKGIKSFFWERDAPGGRRLKKIMYENIHSHERLLFIASKNSLKSEACHYELNEAREKQNKEWGEIYFPIHIDSYLFEVRKEDIPRKHRDAFWENIEEVKEFNSKDFSSFKTKEDYKSKEFEEAVVQLIKDLKL